MVGVGVPGVGFAPVAQVTAVIQEPRMPMVTICPATRVRIVIALSWCISPRSSEISPRSGEHVGSERDATVHLEYRVQKALGDPSPSHTVADMVGLQAANNRQIDNRMRKKVAELVQLDDRFGPLKELAWRK
jgi:hypothetical protein